MKIVRYTLILALIFSFYLKVNAQNGTDTSFYQSFKAMTSYLYGSYKSHYPQVTFLKYKYIMPDNIYDKYKGSPDDSVLSTVSYMQLVNGLDISNFDLHPRINLPYLQGKMFESMTDNTTPISLTYTEYEDYKDSAVILNTVDFDGKQVIDISPAGFYPLKKSVLFAACALNEIFNTGDIDFIVEDSLILSNISPDRIGPLMIDFDDANGFINITTGQVYSIHYNSSGYKLIKTKTVVDNDTILSVSSIQISPSSRANSVSSCNTGSTNPDLGPYSISAVRNGNTITGKYAVWLGYCNASKAIRKPYIISAGFNPGNGKQLLPGLLSYTQLSFNLLGNPINIQIPTGWNGEWRGTYYETYNGGYNKRFSPTEASQCGEGSWNGDRYLDRLRDEGYDVIILMYDNGTDYIQNNAALFEKLIIQVNTAKAANGSNIENVVSGYSAGGSTTRLALANMESKYKQGTGPHPHTKLWVSFETESQGANVPIGLQYLFEFQKNPGNIIPSLNPGQALADMINSVVAGLSYNFNNNPTANQLTKYMASAGGFSHPDRANLLNDFANIPLNTQGGYPQFCRKVAVSQGSSINVNVPHTSDNIFDSKLMFGFNNFTATSFPSGCGGSYTWYMPGVVKQTTAKYNGAINGSSVVFNGSTVFNSNLTILPKICISFFGCHCMGPLTIGGTNVIGSATKYKPTGSNNYDDAPGSTQSAQLEYYGTSAYPFYNNFLAGNAYANRDPKLHSFAPTVSSLDIRDPNTGQPVSNFTSPSALNLLNISKAPNGSLTQHPDQRFGFPYLYYPNNHYQVTPYDGVFAIGSNNGTYSDGVTPKPNNQFHVEDPQTEIGDYLARWEVAQEKLFLTNIDLASTKSNYIAEYEARDRIIAGKYDASGLNTIYSLYSNLYYLSPNGEYKVSQQSTAIMHAGNQIDLLPGFEVSAGASLAAYIKPYTCGNLLYRINNHGNGNDGPVVHNLPNKNVDYENPINKQAGKKINSFLLYPNPGNGSFTYVNVCDDPTSKLIITDLKGQIVYTAEIENNTPLDLNLTHLQNGFYIAKAINANSSDVFKLSITK
ncbi:MAG: T9SS type A sorting domain-containing protein [Bacteroidota bacterium]